MGAVCWWRHETKKRVLGGHNRTGAEVLTNKWPWDCQLHGLCDPTRAPLPSYNLVAVLSIVTEVSKIVQGASQEMDIFEINITPLIFSVEFIYYQEMLRYYMSF